VIGVQKSGKRCCAQARALARLGRFDRLEDDGGGAGAIRQRIAVNRISSASFTPSRAASGWQAGRLGAKPEPGKTREKPPIRLSRPGRRRSVPRKWARSGPSSRPLEVRAAREDGQSPQGLTLSTCFRLAGPSFIGSWRSSTMPSGAAPGSEPDRSSSAGLWARTRSGRFLRRDGSALGTLLTSASSQVSGSRAQHNHLGARRRGAAVSARLSSWDARITPRTRPRWAALSRPATTNSSWSPGSGRGSTRPLTALFRPPPRGRAKSPSSGTFLIIFPSRRVEYLIPDISQQGASPRRAVPL